MASWIIVFGAERLIAKPPVNSGKLHVAPFTLVPNLGRNIRHLLVVANVGRDGFIDKAQISRVDVVCSVFESDCRLPPVLVPEGPSELRRAQKDHSRWPPVIDDVREEVPVHEQAVCLARKKGTPARISVSNTNRSLPRVDSCAV